MENPKPGIRTVGAVELTKAELAKAKADLDLHVLLVMRQDKLAKSKATVVAYAEGEANLYKRLG